MSTVYAAFDSHQAVTAAVDQLHHFGFPPASIHYRGDDSFRSPPAAAAQTPGLLSAVQNFFTSGRHVAARLPADFYEVVIRRGGAVLAVTCDTVIEERTARELLRLAGSIDPTTYGSQLPGEEERGAVAPPTVESNDREVTVGGLSLVRSRDMDDAPAGHATRAASEAELACFRSGVFDIRENVEMISLTKVARVIEELSVNKSISVYTDTVTDTLRGTSVVVEAPYFVSGQ